MARRSRRHSYHDLRSLIQRSFEETPGFGDRVVVDGKINRIAEGIWHDNYWFFIQGQNLTAEQIEQAYFLRLLQQQYDWQRGPESRVRLVREAETLQALATSAFPHPTPAFVCFVKDENSQSIGMIETALSGVSLDRFRERSTLQRISQVAANVHGMGIESFAHLPSNGSRMRHVQSRLAEIDEDLFGEFPLADQVRDWIATHPPSDARNCVLHGDLLPQNLLFDWQNSIDAEELVSVVDWEMAQIGDPAYDLAIVSRGNRKVMGVKNGLQVLLDEYVKFGGRDISVAEVRVHELLLVLHWLEESWREYQKPAPSGHDPQFYEANLQSLFRRTVS
jgi:aminoglycoside phosphotransferase (APT) family kinase protein